MKKYIYPEAIHRAVAEEYERKAPEALRIKIKAMMRLPFVRPWQFAGSVLLLFATPLSFYLLGGKLIYSENMLLLLNISSGIAVFIVIFAGVAHHYANPKNKADLLDRLSALRAKI